MESEVKEERWVQVTSTIHFVPGLPREESILQNMQYNHQSDLDRRRLSLENLHGLYNLSCTQLLAHANMIPTSSSVGAASNQSHGADSQISTDSWVDSWKMESNPSIITPGSSHVRKTGIVGEGTMEKPQRENERKRPRDVDDKAQLKTPPQIQKRKKIRGKVAGDGNAHKSATKSAVRKTSASTAASANKTSEPNSYVRQRRSTKRSLTFYCDFQEEEDYCGLTFTSQGRIGQRMTRSKKQKQEEKLASNDQAQALTSRESLCMFQNKFWLQFPNICRKQRSSMATRRWKFQSLKRGKGYETPQLLQAISLQTQSGVSRKKRSNRDPIASKLNARVLHLQWRRNSTGTSHEELWKQKISIDSITKVLEDLDISTRESLCLSRNRETALILHQNTYEEQKAMVPYRRDGSIIPYPDVKNYRSMVKLDEETTRVWKLLMVSIDSEGIDGSDEDTQKWWEEERKVLHGRANSFIARMRLVQGDRSFSPWKGSIIDSVVGVFLTQNVTDHSSSSAFMDIAAEFPITLNSNKRSCHQEWGSSVTDDTIMSLDQRNVAVATPRICNPTNIIIDEIDDDDTDTVCSQETSKSSDSSTNQSKTMLMDPPSNSFHQGIMVASTSTCCELNLNEVPVEVENYREFINNLDEGRQSQHMDSRNQQKLKNTKKPIAFKRKAAATKNKSEKSSKWDRLRSQAETGGQKRARTERTMDMVDWEALRCTNVNKIADLIRKRGMNDMLSKRIKAFLNRLVRHHKSIDLEWLRDVSPDKAKEYLLSINGLGLKSVECVRLLSLHQIAFPVDTNVGRIVVRLGWVPLQPLPDEVQMHMLELYPVLESVQKYLWPRLCKLDQKTLYELHYHMITFGKVFCTKAKPNCKACPMKAECRHYASARESERLALPEPEERTSVTIHERRSNLKPVVVNFRQSLFLTQNKEQEKAQRSENCEPIIEEPSTPEPECADIEDYPWSKDNDEDKDPWENKDAIPTIMLNRQNASTSKDLVLLSTQAASIPRHKLKTTERLRTEHHVYELPDSHPILQGFERRDPDDMFQYLFAIWTPGETANSSEPPRKRCVNQESNTLCLDKRCFACNNKREEMSQIVRGTVLIPCRTAMRGRFALNGTYFQTNEVFADHASSINPIKVPRESIGGLQRRIVYFGSSVSVAFGGLSVEAIQYGFWTGYVCVRGFDRKSRKPKTLVKRLHCPPRNSNNNNNKKRKKKQADY